MNKYKIKNLRSGSMHFLNEEELINFFKKNSVQNYSITNLTKQKRTRVNKILTNVQLVCFFALTILITIYIIETYY